MPSIDEFIGAAAPDSFSSDSRLEAALQALYQRSRAAWPAIPLAEEAWARDLGRRVGDKTRELSALQAEDLYLACAATRGDARAQAQIDALLPEACAALPGDGGAAFADEIRQLLRQKLFVATEEGAARIAGYTGEGPLRSWLRVAAVRTALSARRRERDDQADDRALEGLAATGPDPELDYLRLRAGADFRAAFHDALAALAPRDRTLLRLYYLDGVGVERLGSVYGVHASTASRWLASIRQKLLLETRRLLAERLHLTGSDVESLLGLVRSHLEVSLQRILAPEETR
jgi:RNA polymerase sigma-70 factor (ECF subfamily)